jgi:thiol-disulfide isomerase/thioredoxin
MAFRTVLITAACLAGVAVLALLLAFIVPNRRDRQGPDFSQEKPAVGDPAPDFVLADPERQKFRLAGALGQHPLVIECGSFTCSFCVMAQATREALAKKYQGKVDFVFVYCQEFHPDAPAGSTVGATVEGPTRTWDERAARAKAFRDSQASARRVLVDEDGTRSVGEIYGNRPNPLIVVGPDGQIILKQDFADSVGLDKFLQAYLDGGT